MDNLWRIRLVEVLACIFCLGLLATLMLPAVNSGGGRSRSVRCRNRLKQLITATSTFETTQAYFPGFQQRGLSDSKPATWAIMVFPYMEQEVLVENWKKTGETAFVSSMVCPSSTVDDFTGPVNNYVANAGFYPRVGDPDFYGRDVDNNGVSDYWDHPRLKHQQWRLSRSTQLSRCEAHRV